MYIALLLLVLAFRSKPSLYHNFKLYKEIKKMGGKNILFLSARVNGNDEIEATIETCICLFVYTYCNLKENICLVDDHENYTCKVSQDTLKNIQYESCKGNQNDVQDVCLVLPTIKADEGRTFIAGVCAVLRWVIKANLAEHPGHFSESLLGFRGGCLVACTESSVWTKFCELEMPSAVSKPASNKSSKCDTNPIEIPSSLLLLEAHLKRPVRTHNILKRKLDIVKTVKKKNSTIAVIKDSTNDSITPPVANIEFTIYDTNCLPLNSEDVCKTLGDLVITEKSQEFSLHHNYLEGIDLTLADMIVFPCVHHLLKNLPPNSASHLTQVVQWYERMLMNTQVKSAAEICGFSLRCMFNDNVKADVGSIVVPEVDKDSLYKRDPAHTKMKIKHRSPCEVLKLLEEACIHSTYDTGFCTILDWQTMPSNLHPANGDLPQKRIERKCQQVESIVTATLKVAVDGQTIVEFCAGGGHVGLLIAYYLPKCKVILIENKESSILRAKCRSEALNLKNIYFYQCNLDYFKGSFDVGIALHACGVATDLVIQQCIKENASFICCPCCYGGIQNTHLLSYPLSKKFCDSSITYDQYTLLAHCADRTEVNTPTAEQGEMCMGLIDMDRVFLAEEKGYDAKLTTLNPLSCSTKHNLLIGRSPKWK